MKLENKVAIVTGSSRGIGKAIALGFAREGADVVVAARTELPVDRWPGTIHETAEEIRALSRKALPVKCDVSSEEDVKKMVQAAMKEVGRIDILVNDAAVSPAGPILEMSVKGWDLGIRVILRGTFLCTRFVLPHMVKQRGGSIINISSSSAVGRVSVSLVSGVAKAGVDRFTWGLAAEVGQYNIAVNAIRPRGGVDTPGNRYMIPQADWSQWGPPDMMVKAAIFLATQDAKGVTGIVSTDEELLELHGLG